MANELYKLTSAAHELALRNIDSIGVVAVRPSFQGKTHTALILQNLSSAYIIWPSSISDQYRFLTDRTNARLIIIDDPSSWVFPGDFAGALVYMKNILGGVLLGSRSTKFSQNIPMPLGHPCSITVLANEEQLNRIYPKMLETGLANRCIFVYSHHSKETHEHITGEYRKCGYNSDNLPKFKVNQFIHRELEEDEITWVQQEFSGMATKIMRMLALFNRDEADELRRFIVSGKFKRYEDEEIEFEVKNHETKKT
jgi:hypothetical protein